MKKRSYLLLPTEINEQFSPIVRCTYDGMRCLRSYIQTRVNQPYCLNCLEELGIMYKFKFISPYKQLCMPIPRNYEVVDKDNGDTYKVFGFTFEGRRGYALTKIGVIIFTDRKMDGNWANERWIIQSFTPRKHVRADFFNTAMEEETL